MFKLIIKISFLMVLCGFSPLGGASNSPDYISMVRPPIFVNLDENIVPSAQFELGCGEVIVGLVAQRLSESVPKRTSDLKIAKKIAMKIAIAALVRRPVERCATQPTVVTLSVPFFKPSIISSASSTAFDHEVAHLQEPSETRFFGSKENAPLVKSKVCAGNSFVAFLWGADPSFLDVALVSSAKSVAKLRQNCSKTAFFSDKLSYLSEPFNLKTRRWQKTIDPWSLVELRVKPTKAVFKSNDGRLSAAVSVDCHERILGAVFLGRELREIGVLVSRFVNQRQVLCRGGKMAQTKVVWHHLPKDIKVDLAQKFLPVDEKKLGVWGARVFVEEPSKIDIMGLQKRIRLSSNISGSSRMSEAFLGVVLMQDHVGRVAAGLLKKQQGDHLLEERMDHLAQQIVDVPASVVSASLKQSPVRLEGLRINAAYF